MTLLPLLFKWHRRVGLFIALPVLLWTLSGVLHPIMSRLNPQPVTMAPPRTPAAAADWIPPGTALKLVGISELSSLRLISIGEDAYYQVTGTNTAEHHYINTRNGQLLEQGERKHAIDIASHFSGRDPSAIIQVARITNFDADYLWINRLLPVWRIDYAGDEHLSVFVETAPARLASMVDDTKRFTSALFRALHNWEWLPQHPAVTTAMIALLTLTAMMGLVGMLLYGLLWKRRALPRRQNPQQRWHRSLGIGVSVFTLFFALSGAWHLLHKTNNNTNTQSILTLWNSNALSDLSAETVWSASGSVIVPCNDHPCRLLAPRIGPAQEHENRQHTNNTQAFELLSIAAGNIEPATLSQLAEFSVRTSLAIPTEFKLTGLSTLTAFTDEYGFLNKRLPVMKLDFDDNEHTTVYWEPDTGAIANIIRDADRYEGFSFGYLHKYHWLDFAGKNVRDSVMTLAALMLAVLTVLGVSLGWRTRQRIAARSHK